MSELELQDLDDGAEDAPLMGLEGADPPDAQPEDKPPQEQPAATRSSVSLRTLWLTALLSVLFVYNDISRYLASLKLLTLGICREYHLEHDPASIGPDGIVSEDKCALPDVQQRLARLSGYMFSLEAALTFVFTIPYGLMLDRLSERLAIALNFTGVLCSSIWLMLICFNWQVLPVSMAVLSPIFSVIGGGFATFDTVIMVIVARHVPSRHRSLCFNLFSAVSLLTQAISLAITGSLLGHGYLFTPVLLNFPIFVVSLACLLLIQTRASPHSRLADRHGLLTWRSLRSEIRSTAAPLRGLMSSRRALCLLAAVPLSRLADPLTEIILLYVQKVFDTSFAYASQVLTFQTIEGLIVLAVALPLIKLVLETRLRMTSARVDFVLTLLCFALLTMGSLTLGLSQSWNPFIFGLIVFTGGWGAKQSLKAVIMDNVSEENIAPLSTIIALIDSVGLSVGTLMLNQSYALAIGWDIPRLFGLPFLIGTVCFIVGAALTWLPNRRVT